MASDADNLATIRSNILATLASESANPKPSYNINGQNVDWNGYRASLMQQLKGVNELMAQVGVYTEVVEGIT